jgi:hypothetical protein
MPVTFIWPAALGEGRGRASLAMALPDRANALGDTAERRPPPPKDRRVLRARLIQEGGGEGKGVDFPGRLAPGWN